MDKKLLLKIRLIAVNKFEMPDWEYISDALGMEPRIDVLVPNLYRKLHFKDVDEAKALAAVAFSRAINQGPHAAQVFLDYIQIAYPEDMLEIDARSIDVHVLKNRWLGDISHAQKDENLISLMTPFDARFDPVNKVLQAVSSELGYRMEHVANDPRSEFIIHKIAQLIYSSRLVVFNITGNNSNVMYELGLAHAMNKDVQIISEDVKGIPFDFSHVRVLQYLPNDEGLRKLSVDFKSSFRR